MLKKDFADKTNEVFHLMMQNNLRKDIDDTLLEKLLHFIKTGDRTCFLDAYTCEEKLSYKPNFYFLKQLLQGTAAYTLIEQSLQSVLNSDETISISTKAFAIQLLGIFLEDNDIFSDYQEDKLLASFTSVCKKNLIEYSPSLQDSILSTLICISKHEVGILYLINEGLITIAFDSFLSSSYYVRKTARLFLVSLFSTWQQLKSLPLKQSMTDVINPAIQTITKKLLDDLKFFPTQRKQIFNECILTLKQLLELTGVKSVFSDHFCLAERISEILDNCDFRDEASDNLLELLVDSFPSSSDPDVIITKVIAFFMEHKLAKSLTCLVFLLARHYRNDQVLFKNIVGILLLPLSIVTSSPIVKKSEIIFQVDWENYHQIVAFEMNEKNECMLLIRAALSALSKLSCFMDSETLALTASLSSKVLSIDTTTEDQHKFQILASTNRKIQLSVLELFSSFTTEKIYSQMSPDEKEELLKSLLSVLEKSTYDNSFISQVLKLIKTILILNADVKHQLASEVKESLINILERKLLDTKWPVVDSALDVVGQLITGKDSSFWEESIVKFNIHVTVWDIAVVGKSEGYVRASALHVIVALCLNHFLWKEIMQTKQVNEVKVVKILCSLANNPDIFIQREAITSLNYWLKHKHPCLCEQDKAKVFKTLTTTVQASLDWDSKLIALQTWNFFAEEIINFQSLDSLMASLENLSDIGYSSSLAFALSDHDKTVQFEAAHILSNLKKNLVDHGYTESSSTFDEDDINNVKDQKSTGNEVEFNTVSQAEREAAMDEVLDMYMINRIQNVLRTDDDFSSMSDSASHDEVFSDVDSCTNECDSSSLFKCSTPEFWRCLWSEKVQLVLKNCEKSSDVYANDPVSLLDDIIAAKIISSLADPVKYQDADCY